MRRTDSGNDERTPVLFSAALRRKAGIGARRRWKPKGRRTEMPMEAKTDRD